MLQIFIYATILVTTVKASVIINRYDDKCINILDPLLVHEIASYKGTVESVMNKIKTDYGTEIYNEYEKFIDTFGARVAGTPVLENAIDYMLNLTSNHNLDVSTEDVQIPHWTRIYENATMIEPRIKKIGVLGFGYSVSTPPGGITAEVIVIESFDELDKTNKAEIEGKIVVLNPDFVSYGETVVYRSQGATKASKKGAVATLVRSITPKSLYTLHTGMQSYGDNVTKIPTAAITVEDADLFMRLQNRGVKIVVHLDMKNSLDTKKSRNTIVDLRGKDFPDKIVAVSGHIDSWDVGEGAIDDGGGMFVSWFAPVLLKKLDLRPKRTVRAILWTAEEMGLIGAAAYLQSHKHELDNFNFIMESDEGTFKPLGLGVAGTKKARCIIAEILKLFSPINKLEEQDYPGSDIVLFVKEGVPGAALLNENERYFWYHHSDADTMNVQNKPDVIKCAAFWAAVSYVIADLSADIPRV